MLTLTKLVKRTITNKHLEYGHCRKGVGGCVNSILKVLRKSYIGPEIWIILCSVTKEGRGTWSRLENVKFKLIYFFQLLT